VVVVIGFFLLSNNNSLFKNGNKSVVHTPVRVGKGVGQAMLESTFTDLKSAINNSDLVIDLTISSWISEDKDNIYTLFNANVNSCLKGNSPDQIVLSQFGSSEFTLKDYPLFDVGDRMIVFLKKAIGLDYEDAYYIIGEYTSIIDIKLIDKTLYAADRYGVLTSNLLDVDKSYFNFKTIDATIRDKFLQQLYLYNTLQYKQEAMYKNFFLYEELINELKNIVIKGEI
jgi:hypothetical protein